MKIFVTGGAGFIGSALIKSLINEPQNHVINVDKLTYAGNLTSLRSIEDNTRYTFQKLDICDYESIKNLFFLERPDILINLAAESHVDRSISGPAEFIQTNIFGTYNLLQVTRDYLDNFHNLNNKFKFIHVSTDEVFGDLGSHRQACKEEETYDPSSPYSASKASSDHLVRAWSRTYGIPIIVTNCTNNYGPFQFPEKLIPVTIQNIIQGKEIPIYGDGKQSRDWLYVQDHVKAISLILNSGKINETYNISANNNISNLFLVEKICNIMDSKLKELPQSKLLKSKDLISFVEDRKGHDIRYALDSTKIRKDLNWVPSENLESGLIKTVDWYINNQEWCKEVIR